MTWALRTDLDLEAANAALPELEEAGVLGMSEEGGSTTLWFADRVAALPIAGRWEEVLDRDWNEAWKAGIDVVVVGRVTIVPPWLEPPADADVVLVVEPGMAFGTGHHETTRSCLAALQELDLRGCRVVDVGTGTGILALAAAALGAVDVVAVDVDPEAVRVARDNATAHGFAIDVREGSATAVAGTYDVVVANLDSPTLTRIAEDLVALVAPAGAFLASGVSLERADDVRSALGRAGLVLDLRPGREWALLVGRRAG